MRVASGVVIAVLVALTLAAGGLPAQFQRRGRRLGPSPPENPKYDGAFQFCRIRFRDATDGDGNGWWVDWPRADTNLTFRLSELTSIMVSRDVTGAYNHLVMNLTDALTLSRCPFTMMTEPGGAYFDENEAAGLRSYIEHGGFLWADDFWGEYAWQHWLNEIRKALPADEFTIGDVPVDHPIFHILYDVHEVPQIPSIGFWLNTGGRTSERGSDSATPHARAAFDANGRIVVFMTHNTDFGDAFEREGDDHRYFDAFAGRGYAVGINVILYAATH